MIEPPTLLGMHPPGDGRTPRPARTTIVLIVAGAALVVVIITTAATLLLHGRRRAAPVDRAALRQQTVQAFAATAPSGAGASAGAGAAVDASAHRSDVEALVHRFRTVVDGKGGLAPADVFDTERLIDEVARHNAQVRRISSRERGEFARGFEQGFTRTLGQQPAFQWTSCDVKRVVAHPGTADELVAYLRMRTPLNFDVKVRWWLFRRDGRWRVYDFEDLDGGFRVSGLVASMITPGGAAAPWTAAMKDLQQAILAMQRGELDQVEKTLERIKSAQFPPEIDGLRHVTTASLQLGRGQFEEALASCDKAAALAPEAPVVDFLRAVALNRLGRCEQAVAAARRYADLLGVDADLAVELGAALEGLGRNDEALQAYRAGLDDQPDSPDNFAGAARLAPAQGRREELGARLARSTAAARAGLFATAAAELDARRQVDALDDLVRAYRAYAADDPWADYYAALVLGYRDGHERALAVLLDVARRLPENQREQVMPALANAAIAAGKPLEAYRASGDPSAAFAYLAPRLGDPASVAHLRALLGAHRARAPVDPWLTYHEARERQLSGDRAAADAAFARAMDAPDEDVRRAARAGRLLARYEAGDVLGAYRDIPPRDETFADLARMCVSEARVEDLERLVGLHRASGRLSDVELIWWDGQSRWARKDYAAAADRFVRYARKLAKDQHGYDVDDSLVRACARAGRWDDALAHLRGRDAEEVDPLHRAVAHAGAGDADQALRAVADCLEYEYVIQDLYADEDLGPLLRSEAMTPVRAKHPDPAAQPAAAAAPAPSPAP